MAYLRTIYAELKKEKDSKKITFLIGARQVGKTTLLRMREKELSKKYPTHFKEKQQVVFFGIKE